jgi:hypothetical protein
VQNDDPAEARRVLDRMEFSSTQRDHLRSLIDAWEAERGG